MRTTLKKNLLVVLMFGTLISYANESITPVNTIGKKKVRVEFKAVKKGQALTIKDKNGVTIYKQKIKNSGTFSKIFDLSNLEDGSYTTELEKDFEIIVKKIVVKNGGVTFLNKQDTKIFKPLIRKQGNLVLISKIDFNKTPLKVVLYYKNDIILSETVKNTNDVLNRAYKLSKEEKGQYKVVVTSEKRSYVKDFTI